MVMWYGAPMCFSATWTYDGPSHAVMEVANAVMASGSILQIAPPATVNASYELRFHGPAVKCSKAEPEIISRIQTNLIHLYITYKDADKYGYLAWNRGTDLTEMEPFQAVSNAGNQSSLIWTPGDGPGPELYVGIFPSIFTADASETFSSVFDATNIGDDIYRCEFRNSTYKVSFNYTGAEQNIEVATIKDLEGGQPIETLGSSTGPAPECLFKNADSSGCTQCCSLCSWDEFPFKTFSYQAVIDAFSQKVKGKIGSRTTYGYRSSTKSTQFDSKVLDTVIRTAPNLASFQQSQTGNASLSATWQAGSGQLIPQVQGLIIQTQKDNSVPFGDMLEQLFANFTISLMSSSALQY